MDSIKAPCLRTRLFRREKREIESLPFWIGKAFARGPISSQYKICFNNVDAYCYGVVVLEIISGQKSGEQKDDDEGEFLLQRDIIEAKGYLKQKELTSGIDVNVS
ncbi:hypothetical protein K1719_035280 [Acacia pycnantha]|nr:hypothetical protein K1719_035280 [Acacia pycnantha]